MVIVYRKYNYYIYAAKDGYIVHNTKKEFSKGHTHINNYHTAKYLIDMSYYSKIPYHTYDYILESLMRISTDQKYIDTLRKLKKGRKKK